MQNLSYLRDKTVATVISKDVRQSWQVVELPRSLLSAPTWSDS